MKLLLPLALLLPGVAFGDCPVNWASSSGPDSWSSKNPVWNQSIYCGSVWVDLPQGFLQLDGGGFSGSEIPCSAYLNVTDAYQVIGPASATPLAFTARIHHSGEMLAGYAYHPPFGNVCEANYVTCDVTSGSNTAHFEDNSNVGCAAKTIDADRTLSLSKLPGESFNINFELRVAGYATGHVRQTLTFEGLPDGYFIASCQGYGGNPTPAQDRSWGSLKASYR